MKVSLGFIQKKNSEIFRSNSSLLNGLNITTIFSLARLHVYTPICFFCAMVGLDVTNNLHNLASLLTIGLANTFALVATFAFNDAEDATDDLLARSTNNVIALGKISKEAGYLVAAVAGSVSLIISTFAGIIVFFVTFAILIIAFFYSWRPFRMKAKPFWDAFTHAVVGGLIFLSPAWSSKGSIIWENHIIQICLIFSLGTVLALLNHGLYEYEDDLKVNTRTTVVVLGKRKSYWIVGFISLIIVSLIIYEFMSGTFPLISVLSFFIVGGILILIPMMLYPSQAISLSKRMIPWGVNTGTAAATIMWYVMN